MAMSLINEQQDHDSAERAAEGTLDANLRAVLPALGLPEPTAAERAGWKQGGRRHEGGERERTVRGWFSRPRMLAAAAGLAMVGAVGAVLLPIHPGTPRVEAATILRSLQAAPMDRVRLAMSGLAFEGNSIDGSMEVRFDRPINFGQLFDMPQLAGWQPVGDQVGAALTPMKVAQASVDLRMVIAEGDNMARFSLRGALGGGADGHENWAMIKADADALRNMGVSFGIPPGGVFIDLGQDALKWVDEANMGGHQRRAGDGPRNADGGSGVVQIESQPGDVGKQVEQALQQLFSGNGVAGLAQLHGVLERAGANATLQQTGDGRYTLSTPIGETLLAENGEVDPELRDCVLAIDYVDGRGVESFRVTGLGTANGTVRLDFLNGPIDPAAFDRTGQIEMGKTLVVPLDAIRAMFGQ